MAIPNPDAHLRLCDGCCTWSPATGDKVFVHDDRIFWTKNDQDEQRLYWPYFSLVYGWRPCGAFPGLQDSTYCSAQEFLLAITRGVIYSRNDLWRTLWGGVVRTNVVLLVQIWYWSSEVIHDFIAYSLASLRYHIFYVDFQGFKNLDWFLETNFPYCNTIWSSTP